MAMETVVVYKASRVCGGCGNLIENTSAHSQKRVDATAKRFEKEGRVCKSCATTATNNKRWENPVAVLKQSQRFLENNPSKGKPAWNRGVPRDEVTKEKIKQTKQLNGGSSGERNANYGKFKHHSTSSDYQAYHNRVRVLTERVRFSIPNYDESKRGKCGVSGAHQIDHIKSILDCWYEGLAAEQAASLNNLRFIPWKENLNYRRWNRCKIKK